MFPRRRYRVAVLGATGAVGREILAALDRRRFPTEEVRALCSPQSAGEEVALGKRKLVALSVVEEQLADVELLLSAVPPEVAARWLPLAKAAGATCLDCSGWAASQQDVPLVVPEVNPEALAGQTGLVASPDAASIFAAMACAPIAAAAGGLRSLDATVLAPASAAGAAGLSELTAQTVSLLNFRPVDTQVFPARLAFNLIPGEPADPREQATADGLARLLDTEVRVTRVQVPVFVGTCLSLTLRLARPVERETVLASLDAAHGLRVETAGAMPMALAETTDVAVSGVRVDGDVVRLWVVGDNLRKGAADNLVQTAELLDAVWTAVEA